jgi:hypothetical protein
MCKETPLFDINLIARYMRRARVRPCCWYLCLLEQGTLNGHINPPKKCLDLNSETLRI